MSINSKLQKIIVSDSGNVAADKIYANDSVVADAIDVGAFQVIQSAEWAWAIIATPENGEISDAKVLIGHRSNGSFYALGLQQSLHNSIHEEHLDESINKQLAEVDKGVFKIVQNDEWAWAVCTLDDDNKYRTLIGHRTDGTFYGSGILGFLEGNISLEHLDSALNEKIQSISFETIQDDVWQFAIVRTTKDDLTEEEIKQVIFGIRNDGSVYPIDNNFDYFEEKISTTNASLAKLEQNVVTLQNEVQQQPSFVNGKGYYISIGELEKEYPLQEVTYVNSWEAWKPKILVHEEYISGGLDPRLSFANVAGKFTYVGWVGNQYKWIVSDQRYNDTLHTFGKRVVLYSSYVITPEQTNAIKEAYQTTLLYNIVQEDGLYSDANKKLIANYNPHLLVVTDAGLSNCIKNEDKATYLSHLKNLVTDINTTSPNTSILVMSGFILKILIPRYSTWIPDIQKQCQDDSIAFHDSYTSCGINVTNNKVIDAYKHFLIHSQRIAETQPMYNPSVDNEIISQGIPAIYIDTADGTDFTGLPKSAKKKMTFRIDPRDSNLPEAEGEFNSTKDEIRGRGNSTWGTGKNPYRLKFNNPISLLGMPAHKNWVLLASLFDKSGIRTSLTYQLADEINAYRSKNKESHWFVPTNNLVEVYLNGRYDGLYCLTDHLKEISPTRANMTPPNIDDIATFNQTLGHYVLKQNIEIPSSGGFLLELESSGRALENMGHPVTDEDGIVIGNDGKDIFVKATYGNEQRYFEVNFLDFYKGDLVTNSSPNGIVLDTYLQSAKNAIERVNTAIRGEKNKSVDGKTYIERVREFIDLETFADYYFIQELSKNADGANYSSIFYLKDRDTINSDGNIVPSPLKAMPLWDYDLAWGNYRGAKTETPYGWHIQTGNTWYRHLFQDRDVVKLFQDRWTAINLSSKIGSIINRCTSMAYAASLRNAKRWKSSKNYFNDYVTYSPINTVDYAGQVAWLDKWSKTRAEFMNRQNLVQTPIDSFVSKLKASANTIFDESQAYQSYWELDSIIKEKGKTILLPNAHSSEIIYGMDNSTGNLVQFDYKRNSEASYFDEEMNLIVSEINMPRIDYGNYGTNPKILIEKERTNMLVLHNNNTYIEHLDLGEIAVNFDRQTNPAVTNSLLSPNSIEGEKYTNTFWYKLQQRVNASGSVRIVNYRPTPGSSITYRELKLKDGIYHRDEHTFTAHSNAYVANQLYNSSALGGFHPRIYLKYLQCEKGEDATSFIPTYDKAGTREADTLSIDISNKTSVYLKTTKQNVVLEKEAGKWNIDLDLENEGIEMLVIFKNILSESEKQQLINQ